MVRSLSNWLKDNPIHGFFVLTFVIAWSIWLPLGFFAPEKFVLSLPGAWAPTLSALILLRLTEGRDGIRRLLGKVFHWRVGFRWYLVVLFGIAAIACLAIGVGTMLGMPAPEISLPNGLPPEALPVVLPILFLVNIFVGGPLAEDIGWRGYILPKLRERMNCLTASLVIGVLWALWHLPYFLFPDWADIVGNVPFVWFVLLTTGWSVLFAWVYVNTESILMPILFHAAINTTLGSLGLLGQGSGDLSPLLLNTLLTWIVVGLVVAFFGLNLQRESAAPQSNRTPWPERS
jgi:membrane protease YdiL (CAAX protease family)